MFVYERIVDEDLIVSSSSAPDSDPSIPRATFDVDVPPLEEDRAAPTTTNTTTTGTTSEGEEMRSIKLRPAARDAYLLLEDLCLLIAGSVEGGPDGEPSFLRWTSLSRTFGLELVESIVSGFGPVVRTVRHKLSSVPEASSPFSYSKSRRCPLCVYSTLNYSWS